MTRNELRQELERITAIAARPATTGRWVAQRLDELADKLDREGLES